MGKWALLASVLLGCAADSPPNAQQYFERDAYPVLEQKCGDGTAGCHAIAPGDPFGEVPAPAFVGLSSDGAYDVLTQEGYTGAFTDRAPLVTAHQRLSVATIDPATLAVIEQWFAIERHERGY